MSDFDDVMIDADADIFTDLGDPATITDTESPAHQLGYPRRGGP